MQDDHQTISELAYQLWESRGRPDGEHDQIWLDAERQLDAQGVHKSGDSKTSGLAAPVIDNTLKDSFPASDPPSSHLPDEPPSNVNDKWVSAGKKPPR